MNIDEFLGTLIDVPRDIWKYHLSADDYSVHLILDDCYKELQEEIDEFVEAWMGANDEKFGHLNSILSYNDYDDVSDYINKLVSIINDGKEKFMDDNSELVGIIDDILKLLDSTLYKLNNLTNEGLQIDYSTITNESQIHEIIEGINGKLDRLTRNPVNYSNLDAAKKHPKNIFKTIIAFTNNKDPKKNKTLNTIVNAIKNLKDAGCKTIPKLFVFDVETLTYEETNGNVLTIRDAEDELTIDTQTNIDTLVISRLGVQGELNSEHVVKLLQDRGLFVLNPVRYSEVACDKYETAVLLQKGNIPQPRFTLMNIDILYDEKTYKNAIKDLYPDWDFEENSNNDKRDVVIKILDGHGGTGVALVPGDKLYSVLQLIFAVSKSRNLILQKKEEADGGDIRVHVLTLKGKQIILAAMKRVKIAGDFRSNVSLGASVEHIKLTKAQEQIALKAASLSKLPWCAVDIMPLVKGSNDELGDNVVLELNASPGTDGVSDAINVNLFNVILNELLDPNDFSIEYKMAGYIESASIDFGVVEPQKYLAKLDTGNSTTASCVEVGDYTIKDNEISFKLKDKICKFKIVNYAIAIVGSHTQKRPVIEVPCVTVGDRKAVRVPIAIVNNRDTKKTNFLINRDLMCRLGYIINPEISHILTPEMQKVKIIN